MSGYHPTEGIFELTGTKAGQWFRRTDLPPEIKGKGMWFYAAVFRHFGYEVPKVAYSYLYVRATPEQVFEALSGKPSDPKFAAPYYKYPASGPLSLPQQEGVRRLPDAILALFRTGKDGLGKPIAEVVASGRSACRVCGEPIAKGATCAVGEYDFTNGNGAGHGPTKCYLHKACLHPQS